jgi:hypothetical protein
VKLSEQIALLRQQQPWIDTPCSPEKLLDFIRRCERVDGKRPKLGACVEEFEGHKLAVLRCMWELRDRGEL